MVKLRPILPEDRERVLDILTSPKVNKTYMLPDYEHREDAVPLFQRLMEMSKDTSKYVRAITVGNTLAGFLNHTEITDTSIELGYVIHPDCQGRGIMTQALTLAIKELFTLGYRRVITGAFSTNAASIRVMEKCGMERMKKTDETTYRGKTHRCVYYSAQNMVYSCCFCGESTPQQDTYSLLIRRAHDSEGPEQELYCHKACLEEKLADPKLLYLKYL